MVRAFQMSRIPGIQFGAGKTAMLPSLIRKQGKNIILVTGEHSFTASAKGQDILQNLRDEGISFFQVKVGGEPSPALIDQVVADHREKGVNMVVAIGGGSVLDAGKAISAMLKVEGSVKDYLEGVGDKEHPGTKVPFIAIPTTSGTGSEATKNAVISEVGENGFKKSLRHDHFIPDLALVDPELTLECPPHITASSGMDSFTQLTEAYLSDNASEYTDALAWMGLKAVKNSLETAVKDGSNIEARADMSLAALNSGICLANAGLGTIHGFASVIGGRFQIPHGMVCGTLMAATNKANVRELRKRDPWNVALSKYARLGRLFIDTPGRQDNYFVDAFIEYLHRLTSDLQLKTLDEYGITADDLEWIAAKTGNKNNPVDLGVEERLEILRERRSG